jgi:hypothetical protein
MLYIIARPFHLKLVYRLGSAFAFPTPGTLIRQSRRSLLRGQRATYPETYLYDVLFPFLMHRLTSVSFASRSSKQLSAYVLSKGPHCPYQEARVDWEQIHLPPIVSRFGLSLDWLEPIPLRQRPGAIQEDTPPSEMEDANGRPMRRGVNRTRQTERAPLLAFSAAVTPLPTTAL